MGANINYDPDFDVIKNEMGKLGGCDWDAVRNRSISVLKNKCKDIRVISFLALVFLKNSNWEELADLFEGLALLSVNGVAPLHPEREVAKNNAIKWLGDLKFADALNDKKPVETDHDHCVRLVNALESFKTVCAAGFTGGSPFPSAFLKAAQGWQKVSQPKPAETAPVPASAGAAAVASYGAGTSNVAVTAEPLDTPKQAQLLVRKAATALIDKEPQRPMGYRIMRAVRWDMLEKVPPSEGGKTQLPAPRAEQRAYFATLLSQKDWKNILEKGEKAFTGEANHVWLDLQRLIVTACKELGDQYADVRQALIAECAALVRRIPGLLELTFVDGTPFCDGATKDWIAAELKSSGQGTESSTSAAQSESQSKVAIEQKEVNAMLATGSVGKALDYLHGAIRNSSNERDNFRRSQLLSTILISAKQPDIAVSILESLNSKISAYHLDTWDPELAVEAWTILYKAYGLSKNNKTPPIQIALQEKQNTILGNISRIDPTKAFSLTV